MKPSRPLVLAVAATAVVLIMIFLLAKHPGASEKSSIEPAAFGEGDRCATCHRRVSPDIVNQFATSTMAQGSRITKADIFISKTPISLVGPNLFFMALMMRYA